MEVSIQSLGLRNFEMPFCNFESCCHALVTVGRDTMLLPASRFSANNFLCFATRASAAAMQSLFIAITDDGDAEHYVIYLSPKLSPSSAVYLSNVWDDYNSRVMDNNELVSHWLKED